MTKKDRREMKAFFDRKFENVWRFDIFPFCAVVNFL